MTHRLCSLCVGAALIGFSCGNPHEAGNPTPKDAAGGAGGSNATGGIGGNGGLPEAGPSGSGGASGNGGASGSSGTTGTSGGTGGGASGSGGNGGVSGSGGNGGASGGGGSGGASGSMTGTGGFSGTSGGGASGTSGSGGANDAGDMRDSASTDGGTRAPSFFIGADITWVQADEAGGATYSDGTRKEILQLLKDHGFNYVRLRTFVDPKAADGYDKQNGYGDLAHTLTFGKRIKAAGMGFLLDFHYSDNWADPGKQCVPVAWQGSTSIAELATAVHDYTKDAVAQLVAAGARPDMVQIGNEITPGMLLHRCDSGGLPTGSNPVTGSIANWTNLGTLLKAGVQGVKDVDASIKIMLHIDRGGTFNVSRDFIANAISQAVPFDVFGESCYTAYQGQPSAWMSTFTQLGAMFPNLRFVIAEYGPEQRAANDVVFNLPNQQGIGTFNWEPTHGGAWNTDHALFSVSGKAYTATADLALYDLMKTAYASRL
ncbi:MAG TPA: glycosyl hydrolase 53 family protein [Polyangiaceae bacterium]|nr:glycosyl hydrolase 53 family protein [Polyangiaceae bacterium]